MIPNPFPGKFIVFEGADGCGKTAQLEKTFKWIYDNLRCCTVIKTKEPDKNSIWGSLIYRDLDKTFGGLHQTDPRDFQTWYACDSKQHMQKSVIPRLTAGCVVLSDRYRPSLCYGALMPDGIPALMEMNQRIMGEHFIWPDLIFIFEVSPETSLARMKASGKKLDGHEIEKTQKRVIENYHQFGLMYKNCHLINAERPVDDVFEDVATLILSELAPGL